VKCWCLLYEWTYSLPSYRKVQCTVVSLYIFLVACQSVCFDDVCFWCQWHLEYLLFTAYTWCSSFLVCSCQTLAQKKPSPTEGGHSHPEPLQRCSSTRHVHRFCVFFLQSAELQFINMFCGFCENIQQNRIMKQAFQLRLRNNWRMHRWKQIFSAVEWRIWRMGFSESWYAFAEMRSNEY